MNTDDAKKLANELMDTHLGLNRDWVFRFDNANKRFGCCRYGDRTITLSRNLTEVNALTEVKNTILHEIAHALAGRAAGHGPTWQAIARRIGSDGKRCYSNATVQPSKGTIFKADLI